MHPKSVLGHLIDNITNAKKPDLALDVRHNTSAPKWSLFSLSTGRLNCVKFLLPHLCDDKTDSIPGIVATITGNRLIRDIYRFEFIREKSVFNCILILSPGL